MENRYSLFHNTMLQLQEEGVLSEIILIGGWCPYIYTFMFEESDYIPQLRTADIDILIPNPNSISIYADLPSVFSKLGYEEILNYPSGHSHFSHPDLDIEFLISEKGKPRTTPYDLKNLKVKALGLTYLEMLVENTLLVQLPDFEIRVPRPAAYVLHKLLLAQRRKDTKKRRKDLQTGNELGEFLISDPGLRQDLIMIYKTFPASWKSDIRKSASDEISNLLE